MYDPAVEIQRRTPRPPIIDHWSLARMAENAKHHKEIEDLKNMYQDESTDTWNAGFNRGREEGKKEVSGGYAVGYEKGWKKSAKLNMGTGYLNGFKDASKILLSENNFIGVPANMKNINDVISTNNSATLFDIAGDALPVRVDKKWPKGASFMSGNNYMAIDVDRIRRATAKNGQLIGKMYDSGTDKYIEWTAVDLNTFTKLFINAPLATAHLQPPPNIQEAATGHKRQTPKKKAITYPSPKKHGKK